MRDDIQSPVSGIISETAGCSLVKGREHYQEVALAELAVMYWPKRPAFLSLSMTHRSTGVTAAPVTASRIPTSLTNQKHARKAWPQEEQCQELIGTLFFARLTTILTSATTHHVSLISDVFTRAQVSMHTERTSYILINA